LQTSTLCFQHFLSTLQKNGMSNFGNRNHELGQASGTATRETHSSSLGPSWVARCVSWPSFADPDPLFSSFSVYIAKKRHEYFGNRNHELGQASGAATRGNRFKLIGLSWIALCVSWPSFADLDPLFSTFSVYIAKKRHAHPLAFATIRWAMTFGAQEQNSIMTPRKKR
jgi:hypothetical protein